MTRLPTARLSMLVLAMLMHGASAQSPRHETPKIRTLQPPAPTAPECTAGMSADECAQRRKRKEEEERTERSTELSSPSLVGEAPLPPQGAPPPPPRIERGPLKIQRYEATLAVDHALSREWVLGALVGSSRGTLKRSQDEITGLTTTHSDSTVRTRSTTLALTLSHTPAPGVFVDGALSLMRTRFDVKRVVNDRAEFSGDNAGRGIGLSLEAGRIYRGARGLLVPHVGLDYVRSRVDPLDTTYFLYASPGVFEGFHIGPQRQQVLNLTVGTQLQWPLSTGFGTVTPYLRGAWRQRAWMKAGTVVTSAPAADDRLFDPESQHPRHALTIAGGTVLQFTHGVSVYADLSHARGAGDLRDTRLAVGAKFEY
jgi:outer membrane autotransporter protein